MRRVRCVSPHGGAHHGLRADNELPAAPGFDGPLTLPPNEGGWIWNAVLGHVAVGSEVDAPDDFTCDGFHFTDVPRPAPPPPDEGADKRVEAAPSLASLLGKGDS